MTSGYVSNYVAKDSASGPVPGISESPVKRASVLVVTWTSLLGSMTGSRLFDFCPDEFFRQGLSLNLPNSVEHADIRDVVLHAQAKPPNEVCLRPDHTS